MNIGDKINRLTITSAVFMKNGRSCVECKCVCGTSKVVRFDYLKSGELVSCGCFRVEQLRKKLVKHDKCKDKIYSLWEGIIQRCTNPKSTSYQNYGGRGITICDDWLEFENFYRDVGDKPKGLSLDRIDNNKGYSKDNCRWATPSLQGFNTRLPKNNTSGHKGVSWDSSRNKWASFIMKDRKKIYLGRFDNMDDAVSARKLAEVKYFPEAFNDKELTNE